MRYFQRYEYDEGIETLEYFKGNFEEITKEENTDKLELYEMKRDYGGKMWCEEYEEFVIKGESCGKIWCVKYNPCNGKSGRCRNLKNGFIETGNKFILDKNGIKEA